MADAAFLLRAFQADVHGFRLKGISPIIQTLVCTPFPVRWAMADRISAHRYYDGSDSCQASPRPAGLLAYLAHTSQRSASNHKGDPDIALHAISAYPMCFRLRLLPASSPSLPAESSSSSCGPPVRLRLLSTPPRSDAVTFGYRALAYPDTDSHRAVCAPSRAH